MNNIDELLAQYPFLSFVTYTHSDYLGVIQNHDGDVVSLYSFSKLRTSEEKRLFLEWAEIWFNESNRKIPINIFLKKNWKQFNHTLITLIAKDIKEIKGHCVYLSDLAEKRTKRKSIILVKKL
jgi:hypothetical protein